jgi:hypothetical protein
MTRVTCDPGVCGNNATIEVNKANSLSAKADSRTINLKILSKCEKVSDLASRLANLDEGELSEWEAIKPRGKPRICKCAIECRLCAACPIPTAILKAMEVEAGLAAAKSVHIYFEAVA